MHQANDNTSLALHAQYTVQDPQHRESTSSRTHDLGLTTNNHPKRYPSLIVDAKLTGQPQRRGTSGKSAQLKSDLIKDERTGTDNTQHKQKSLYCMGLYVQVQPGLSVELTCVIDTVAQLFNSTRS